MALIPCPNCGETISDKANVCVKCHVSIVDSQPNIKKCIECGTELTMEDELCPNCGCPVADTTKPNVVSAQKVEISGVSFSPKLKKKIFIVAVSILIAIIVIVGSIFIIKNAREKAAEKERIELEAQYYDNLQEIYSLMYLGGAEAESCGGLIHDVWYNTIYEERDFDTDPYTRPHGYFEDSFNDSLSNLFADYSFNTRLSSIESYQSQVQDLMRELRNPPDKYKREYEILCDCYDAFNDIVGCATNPSGSLTSYTSTFNTADSELAQSLSELGGYLD